MAKNQKVNKIPFERNYKNWMVNNGLNSGSADSYCNYIRSLNQKFFRPISKYGISALDAHTAGTLDNYNDWLSILMRYLGLLIDEAPKYGYSSKTVSNYQSAFFNYIHFLYLKRHNYSETLKREVKIYEGDENDYLNNGTIDYSYAPLVYGKNLLLSNFSWRLSTQNRLSGPKEKLLLPLGLISMIFNKTKTGNFNYLDDEWAPMCAKKIDIHVPGGRIFKLNQIVSLIINPVNGSVMVKTRQGVFDVLTPIAVKKNNLADGESKFTQLLAYNLRDIHIDHKDAIDGVLKNKKITDTLKSLQKLTDWLHEAEAVLGKRITVKQKSKFFKFVLDKHSDELEAITKGLEDDLRIIGDKCQLQLMEAKENYAKSNK